MEYNARRFVGLLAIPALFVFSAVSPLAHLHRPVVHEHDEQGLHDHPAVYHAHLSETPRASATGQVERHGAAHRGEEISCFSLHLRGYSPQVPHESTPELVEPGHETSPRSLGRPLPEPDHQPHGPPGHAPGASRAPPA